MATISSLLADHVTLRLCSVDRVFLVGYVPALQSPGLLVRFLNQRVGGTIPSPAILGKIGRGYVDAVDRFAEVNEIPLVRFAKGVVKEDVARTYMQRAEREGCTGVVMIGVAQEKALAWRGWRDGGSDAHPHFEFGPQAIFVNHYYFYLFDPEWGPSFIKTNGYAPDPVWVYLTGHEWAKRQAARDAIEFTALDSGFRACDQAEQLAAICDSLSHRDIEAFMVRRMRVLPSPFTPAERGRYGHKPSVCQLKLSDTRVFDRPARKPGGRGLSRRSAISSISADRTRSRSSSIARSRPAPPAGFQTKVITKGVEPLIQAHYKHSKVKQYFKEAARYGPKRPSTTPTTSGETHPHRHPRADDL